MWISEYIIECKLSGCINHTDIPIIETYEKIFNERKTELVFEYGHGGQFIVSKPTILKKPKEFYNKMVELLDYDIDPIEGYIIEKFHQLIFE
jgi:hypothetical protein